MDLIPDKYFELKEREIDEQKYYVDDLLSLEEKLTGVDEHKVDDAEHDSSLELKLDDAGNNASPGQIDFGPYEKVPPSLVLLLNQRTSTEEQAKWIKENPVEPSITLLEVLEDDVPEFDESIDLAAAYMSLQVYNQELKEGDQLNTEPDHPTTISWECTGVYIGTGLPMVETGKFSLWKGNDGEYYAICIRGTAPTNPTDWWTNLTFVPANINANGSFYPLCLTAVHKGFRDRVIDLLLSGDRGTALETMLNLAKTNKKPVLVTGHSLGGATANLLCQMLVNKWNGFLPKFGKFPANLLTLVTFGQPRLYTPASSIYRFSVMKRYVNYSHAGGAVDFIPFIPPLYVHGSKASQLCEKGATVISQDKEEYYPDWFTFKSHPSLSEHGMKLYCNRMQVLRSPTPTTISLFDPMDADTDYTNLNVDQAVAAEFARYDCYSRYFFMINDDFQQPGSLQPAFSAKIGNAEEYSPDITTMMVTLFQSIPDRPTNLIWQCLLGEIYEDSSSTSNGYVSVSPWCGENLVKDWPVGSGCYHICCNEPPILKGQDVVMYVGQCENFQKRMISHFTRETASGTNVVRWLYENRASSLGDSTSASPFTLACTVNVYFLPIDNSSAAGKAMAYLLKEQFLELYNYPRNARSNGFCRSQSDMILTGTKSNYNLSEYTFCLSLLHQAQTSRAMTPSEVYFNFYAAGMDMKVYRHLMDGEGGWECITNGDVTQVVVARNPVSGIYNGIYGLGTDKCIWKWENENWTTVTGGSVTKFVISDDNIYGLGTNNAIWKWTTNWTQVTPGIVTDFTLFNGYAYGVGTNGAIWKCSLDQGDQGQWEMITGSIVTQVQVVDGTIWGLGTDKAIWKWTDNWTRVTGSSVTSFVISGSDIYGVGEDKAIWKSNTDGAAWVRITGGSVTNVFLVPRS